MKLSSAVAFLFDLALCGNFTEPYTSNYNLASILLIFFYLILYPQFDDGGNLRPYFKLRESQKWNLPSPIQFNHCFLLEADGKRMERKQHLHPFLALRFAKRVHVEEATR